MFPGADTDREAAEYVIVGAPLDASTTFRPGARFGPEEIRSLARSFENYDHRTGQEFTDLQVHDHGDIHPGGDVEDFIAFLRGTLGEYHDTGVVPLLVGGEHTVTVAGVEAVEPDVFVCFDAHLDLRESYDGNPLSHATVTHHALSVADEAIVLGARSGSRAEWDRAAGDDNITIVPPEAVDSWQPEFDEERVYLSVDVDVVDPAFAPATGTPEPFGLDSATVHELLRTLAPHSVGFDVVEVTDRDEGQTALLAAKLLRAFVFAHADG